MVSSLFLASAQLIHGLFSLLSTLVMVRIVMSWVQPNPGPGFIRSALNALYQLTDPLLKGTRRLLPFLVVGGLDLSPIALFFGIQFADSFLTNSLMRMAYMG